MEDVTTTLPESEIKLSLFELRCLDLLLAVEGDDYSSERFLVGGRDGEHLHVLDVLKSEPLVGLRINVGQNLLLRYYKGLRLVGELHNGSSPLLGDHFLQLGNEPSYYHLSDVV